MRIWVIENSGAVYSNVARQATRIEAAVAISALGDMVGRQQGRQDGMAGNLIEVAALPLILSRHARLLGVDLGTKTIGIAVSDVERRIGSPVKTIKRTKFSTDAKELAACAEQFDVAALVIGLPLNMDGTEGPRVQSTRAFVRNMAGLMARPFVFWDERLSTAAVTRSLIEQDASRAKRAEVIDRMAAAYILQGVLDRLERMGRSPVT